MNAIQFLEEPSKLKIKIRTKKEQKDLYKSLISEVYSIDTTKDKVKTSRTTDCLGDKIAEYCDIDSEIDNLVMEYIDSVREVNSVIEKLPVHEYDLLHKRYIEEKSNQDIMLKYDYSVNWFYGKMKKAIDDVQIELDKRDS